MQWEYECSYLKWSWEPSFSSLGRDGWELVAIAKLPGENKLVAYFKRPVLPAIGRPHGKEVK